MQDIPVHLLKAFVVFVEAKNINEAAAQLGVTQPALSKQLKQLEQLLPARALALSGRKKVTTPFGRQLHKELKNRFGGLQELVQQTWLQHSDARQARVRIAARRGILDRMSASVSFPGAVEFLESTNAQTLQLLKSLDAEIGIVHGQPETGEFTAKLLFREEFQLVLPKGLMARKPHYDDGLMKRLADLPCLAYKSDDEILRALCTHHDNRAGAIQPIRSTENYSSLAQMSERGLGWTLLPTYLPVSEDKSWCIRIPSQALPDRRFYLVYRSEFLSVIWFKELLQEIRCCFAVTKDANAK